MAKVIFRQAAIDDLNDIWEYSTDEWSENQAEKYFATLKLVCKEIGANPGLGKNYSKINKGLLGIKSGKHIIFYQVVDSEEVEVLRILHERMDLKNRLNE